MSVGFVHTGVGDDIYVVCIGSVFRGEESVVFLALESVKCDSNGQAPAQWAGGGVCHQCQCCIRFESDIPAEINNQANKHHRCCCCSVVPTYTYKHTLHCCNDPFYHCIVASSSNTHTTVIHTQESNLHVLAQHHISYYTHDNGDAQLLYPSRRLVPTHPNAQQPTAPLQSLFLVIHSHLHHCNHCSLLSTPIYPVSSLPPVSSASKS